MTPLKDDGRKPLSNGENINCYSRYFGDLLALFSSADRDFYIKTKL